MGKGLSGVEDDEIAPRISASFKVKSMVVTTLQGEAHAKLSSA